MKLWTYLHKKYHYVEKNFVIKYCALLKTKNGDFEIKVCDEDVKCNKCLLHGHNCDMNEFLEKEVNEI